ncbi:hypothetical protein TNCV_4852331 [Trichonephila clavipes]|nr:hypothetical protein TNCV_4852331 [Trichonephila clavipes]
MLIPPDHVRSRPTKFIMIKGYVHLSLAVALSITQETIHIGSVPNPILRENTLEGGQGFPHLFPFHQPHERTGGPMNI